MASALLQSYCNCGFSFQNLSNREEGSPTAYITSKRVLSRGSYRLAQQATATGRTHGASAVAGLARFFPEAAPVRIPVQLFRTGTADGTPATSLSESTVIEFGTPREVMFSCNTLLEFADVLRLRTADGSFDIEASVVAVQYHPGYTIVAARFLKDVPNWIVKS